MPSPDALTRRAEIGRSLRDLRREAGLTQARLARAAATGQASLSNYENGKRDLPLITALRLTGALGRSLGDLFEDVSGVDVIRDARLARAAGVLSESSERIDAVLGRADESA